MKQTKLTPEQTSKAALALIEALDRVTMLLHECEARELELAAEYSKLWKMMTKVKASTLTTGKLRRALYGEE